MQKGTSSLIDDQAAALTAFAAPLDCDGCHHNTAFWWLWYIGPSWLRIIHCTKLYSFDQLLVWLKEAKVFSHRPSDSDFQSHHHYLRCVCAGSPEYVWYTICRGGTFCFQAGFPPRTTFMSSSRLALPFSPSPADIDALYFLYSDFSDVWYCRHVREFTRRHRLNAIDH